MNFIHSADIIVSNGSYFSVQFRPFLLPYRTMYSLIFGSILGLEILNVAVVDYNHCLVHLRSLVWCIFKNNFFVLDWIGGIGKE